MTSLNAIQNVYYKLPFRVKYAIASFYWKVKKSQIKSKYYMEYNKNTLALIKPFKLYWIKPSKIEYEINEGSGKYPKILAGDWDKNTSLFKDKVRYRSIRDRFVHNKDWEETEDYKQLKREYGSVDNLKNKYKYGEYINRSGSESISETLKKYDKIYEEIKNKGYKTQKEALDINTRVDRPKVSKHIFPEFHDIGVDIDRNGQPLFFQGSHRLSIAKILDIDKVPVRIRNRHQIWQKKRVQTINNKNDEEYLKHHFDIKPFMN